MFVIGSVQDLKSGRTDVAALARRAAEFGLLRERPGAAASDGAGPVGLQAAGELVEGILAASVSGRTGRRTSQDIVERLLRKAGPADRPQDLHAALEVVSALVHLEGPPTETMERAREIVEALGQSAAPFERLQVLFDALAAGGVDAAETVLDLGLARGIAYYSGMIFELVHPACVDGASLGGGGRYDGLIRALGGGDMPALGFAYTVELVVKAREYERSAAGSSA